MKRVFVFDVDGVLADNRHRSHLLDNKTKHNKVRKEINWELYFDRAEDDTPVDGMIQLARSVISGGNRLILVTNRPERLRRLTQAWLGRHGMIYDSLFLREDSDRRKDCTVKEEAMKDILSQYDEVALAIDDKHDVTEKYRYLGVNAMQFCLAHE